MTKKVGIVLGPGFLSVYLLAFMCLAGCNSASLRSLSIWKSTGDGVATIEETISDSEYFPSPIWHESYEEAQLSAIEQGKPILAGFTGSDWCRPCKQLKTDVLDSEEFVTWAGGKVVLLELDYPKRTKQSAESKEQNEDLKQRYQISKYPTILLLDQDGEVLGEIDVANNTATAFIENAESILSN
ncbi:thioredoxin family protein [Mariniblastus sp.]|nr:thioredoxin family protein [Mariniblastus sp.]